MHEIGIFLDDFLVWVEMTSLIGTVGGLALLVWASTK